MKFPSQAYPSEGFTVEGGKSDVAFVLPGKRSGLGNFVDTHDVILPEGLLGGVLNAAWPLFDPAQRGAKVGYDGLKSLEGRELHRLRYRRRRAKTRSDALLRPDTFRHVASVYKASQAQQLGTIESSSRQPDMYPSSRRPSGDWKVREGPRAPHLVDDPLRDAGQGDAQSWKYDCGRGSTR